MEWNLRDILKEHVITLLQNQKSYWKQRGKIKWVKLGHENTRFFHAKATINFRHNYISMLNNNDGAEITDHDGKANILWAAFKDRLESTENRNMHFNLQDFFGNGMDSDMSAQLEVPFTDKEIEDVVKDLPNNKSPGPNGFNNEFIKNCWSIIGPDIKKLINDFYDGSINLESINSSFITLIPKVEHPISPGDFRPNIFA